MKLTCSQIKFYYCSAAFCIRNVGLTGGENTDWFVFCAGFDRDLLHDLQDDLDVIVVDDTLWTRTEAVTEVLSELGTQDGNHFELVFGSGDILIIRLTTTAQLPDDYNIV